MAKTRKPGTTTALEKFCYAMGNAGGNFIWTFTGSFLTLYYTDSVYMAAGFVGTMMVVARILDGISDILFGMVMEKNHFKRGKAWPWLAGSVLPLIISFLLVFNVPMGLSVGAQKTYITVTYILLTVVTYTIFNLAFYALIPRISMDPYDRSKLTTVSSIFGFVAGLALSIATMPILDSFGGIHEAGAWKMISMIYAVMGLICLIICTLGTKEKIPVAVTTEKKDQYGKGQLMHALKALLTSRYFYIALLIFILNSMVSGIALGNAAYYAKDVIGDANSYTPIALVYALTTVVGMTFCPKLIQKIGKRKAMMAGSIVSICGYLVAYLNPSSLPVVLISLLISSFGSSTSVGQWTFSAEIVDYMEPRIGMRVEGLATSATSCGAKIGTGLGSATIGWGLAIGGYAGNLAVQPDSVKTVLIFLFAGLPAILCVVRFVIMYFWDIDKYIAE